MRELDDGRHRRLRVVEDLQLRGTFLQHRLVHDRVAAVDVLSLVAGKLMATERETPARSRLRTADRRRS